MDTNKCVKRIRYLCQLISLGFTFGLMFFMILIWFVAYFGNATVLVTINEYGEMIPELYMWFILVPIVIYGFYYNLQEVF